MPGYDRTGPQGEGPKTGRGMGYCETNVPRGVGRGRGNRFGQGLGQGFGRGFGRRNVPYQKMTAEQEKAILEQNHQYIEKRLKELEE